jgi:hypothetical protein
MEMVAVEVQAAEEQVQVIILLAALELLDLQFKDMRVAIMHPGGTLHYILLVAEVLVVRHLVIPQDPEFLIQ